jgi:hypothetical protein
MLSTLGAGEGRCCAGQSDGESKGFAFITMATPAAAEHALNLTGSFMEGRYRTKGGVVLSSPDRRGIQVNTVFNDDKWEVVDNEEEEEDRYVEQKDGKWR